jgi:glycerophosphoryl diester phosphodiesterase
MLDRTAFLRPIAHRGLHEARHGIIENTGPAFEAAIAADYGIECDVRPIRDGLPVIFHDQKLNRLIEGRGPLAAVKERELRTLHHRIGGTRILTLADFLDLVKGRVPLLIEIKSEWQPPDRDFLASISSLVSRYRGPIALMSFDPAVMVAVRSLAPSIPRGIVSGSYAGAGWWSRMISRKRAAALRNLLESGPVAPDFYAYQVDALPAPVIEYARRVSGLPLFAWTVRTGKQRRIAEVWADAMMFECFRP